MHGHKTQENANSNMESSIWNNDLEIPTKILQNFADQKKGVKKVIKY